MKFRLMSAAIAATLSASWIPAHSIAHAQNESSALVGAWTLKKELSDVPDERLQGRGGRPSDMPRGGGFGRGGRGGGGGFPGGGGGFPGGGVPGGVNPEEMARRQEALRGFIDAPNRLTIVQTESMMIVTTDQGKTVRLSLDDKRIKDESTNVERKSRWEGGKLVSDVTTAVGTIKEIYSVDTAHHELLVIVRIEPSERQEVARVFHRLYAADGR